MTMTQGTSYRDLGDYGDWVDEARSSLSGLAPELTVEQLRGVLTATLAFGAPGRRQTSPTIDQTWRADGLRGEAISWDVGYGPRTRGWVLRPDTDDVLPGVVALHCHGHHKVHGKEKLANGPAGPVAGVAALRAEFYDGRALAHELARQGFVVLVHDVFLWGSRRFDLSTMERALGRTESPDASGTPDGYVARYNRVAIDHEHLVAKYCSALGTHLGAVVSHEDRIAVDHFVARPDVASGGVGIVGFSGGGARAAFLMATSPRVRAAVVVGMMSSHRHVLDRHVAPHTWMFFPPELARIGDWPDVAASGAPVPLLVQYGQSDPMFTAQGMRAAHEQLGRRYLQVGAEDAYTGEFYDSAHRFTAPMQDRAFAWLSERLR